MDGAIMTTYPFSPQFFEEAVLPALRQKNIGDRIAVLVDSTHYETTVRQLDSDDSIDPPKYAGQRYNLAPVTAGQNRAFHPKIHYITGERRVHATITSGNITHPGFTHNQEIATSFTIESEQDTEDSDESTPHGDLANETRATKASLCVDIAEFFDELLQTSLTDSIDPVTEETIQDTIAAGDWIRDIDGLPTEERNTAILHNLNESILPQVHDNISRNNEVLESVDIVVPFYGSSLRIPHQYTDDGIAVRLWLQQGRTQIEQDQLADWLSDELAEAYAYESTRYVHGKVILLQSDSATYCLSGSPNGSIAALLSTATSTEGNVEVASLRREPIPEYFDHMLDSSPFTEAEQIEAGAFAPGSISDFGADERTDNQAESNIVLFGAGYRRRSSYDGGKLVIAGRASQNVRNQMEESGVELLIEPTNAKEDPTSIRLEARNLDWEVSDQNNRFSAAVELYGEARDRLLSRTATVWLEIGDFTSTRRWLQTRTPIDDEPNPEDVEEAGAETVPRSMMTLFQADPDRQSEVTDSLNALLSALGSVEDLSREDRSTDDREKLGPSGGLRVRPWTQSSKKDPGGLVESFYDGWEEDLRIFIREAGGDSYYLQEVATRLKAINSTSLHLLLIDEVRPNANIPRETVLRVIKSVYSERDPATEEVTSKVGDYCANMRFYAEQSVRGSEDLYGKLQESVMPHVILSSLIAEVHIAGDRETYFNQQDWAFEDLIGNFYPDQFPGNSDLTDARLSGISSTILDATAGIRDVIEESRRYRGYSDDRYLEDSRLKSAILELMARSILYSGKQAIRKFRANPRHEAEIERGMEKNLEYLPSERRRRVKTLF